MEDTTTPPPRKEKIKREELRQLPPQSQRLAAAQGPKKRKNSHPPLTLRELSSILAILPKKHAVSFMCCTNYLLVFRNLDIKKAIIESRVPWFRCPQVLPWRRDN